MKINLTLSVNPTISGIPVTDAVGFLNVYRLPDGGLISGGKLYASADEARRRSRGKSQWTLIGQVNVADYVRNLAADIEPRAKSAAIEPCNRRLKLLLGLPPGDFSPVYVERESPVHPVDATPEPHPTTAKRAKPLAKKKAPVKKPVSKAKKPTSKKSVAKTPVKKKIVAKAKPAPKAKKPAAKKK